MTALPPLADTHLVDDTADAYNACLAFESASPSQAKDDTSALLHARVLGFLVIHTSTVPRASEEVVRAIHACAQDLNTLSELGRCYVDDFIRPFIIKKFKSLTPFSSDSKPTTPPRNPFDRIREGLNVKTLEAPRTHVEAKEQALFRDGFRSVFDGPYDVKAEIEVGITPEHALAHGGFVYTKCAQILPESTFRGVGNKLLSCFDIPEPEMMNAPSLVNVMTVDSNRHYFFNHLNVWLEKLSENHYKVCATNRGYRLPPSITFTTPNDELLPVPSEALLAVHALCCKVAHASGAGKYLEEMWREVDERGVLKEDGASAGVLESALLSLEMRRRSSE